MPRPRSKGATGVRTLERGLGVLRLLAEGERTLSELSKEAGLSKSTLYRLLTTLVRAGFAEERGGRYRVGPVAFAVGQAYRTRSLSEAARPWMLWLRDETGESVNLAVRSGLEALYVDQVEGRQLVRLFTEPGTRAPLHATGVGKVFLAYEGLPEDLPLEAYTPNTRTDPRVLAEELAQVRAQGYALDDEEKELGVRCVAAPIFGPAGEVVAALSLSAPASRLPLEAAHALSGKVREAALKVSLHLGYRPEYNDLGR
ncbi:IclR family transcriptional regulator [Thermus filiformis]|uniref:IclR family transcriptional regulator n=1 Tax=Thermus filiformis TaxID=276 RepID=A0A0A2WT02_THEFI|nr:IclR family transcriptional regulator [Thermus filiformis]KGQ21897.2 IclR family transcriptional regulator [Thermus filiformis]